MVEICDFGVPTPSAHIKAHVFGHVAKGRPVPFQQNVGAQNLRVGHIHFGLCRRACGHEMDVAIGSGDRLIGWDQGTDRRVAPLDCEVLDQHGATVLSQVSRQRLTAPGIAGVKAVAGPVPCLDGHVGVACCLGLGVGNGIAIGVEILHLEDFGHAGRAPGNLREVYLGSAIIHQIGGLDGHRGGCGVRDQPLVSLDHLKPAGAGAPVEIVGNVEVVGDQQIERAIHVHIRKQDAERFAGNAGQIGKHLARHLPFVVPYQTVTGFFAGNAPIPARGPVAHSHIQIAIAVGIPKAQRHGHDRVCTVGDGAQVRDVELPLGVGQQVHAATIGGEDQIGPAIVVDICENGVKHGKIGELPKVDWHARKLSRAVVGVKIEPHFG
mmetsp:Transcript_20417/g.32958  ORF Transcript_20417/g.32958 Transcript_20417/m.32958 type:complete len:380 (+) Transcript_20417:864-2003(+)